MCCCLIPSPDTRLFRRIICSLSLRGTARYLNAYHARTHVLSRLAHLSSPSTCAQPLPQPLQHLVSFAPKTPNIAPQPHSTLHFPPPPASILASVPHVTQSFRSNRAVGLPHCHTRRHPEPPAHQSPRPISPDWPASDYAQLALQRARLADRILLRQPYLASRSARLPSGGLHDILLPLDFCTHDILARKLC